MKIIIPKEFDGFTLRSYLKNTLCISTKVLARLKKDEHGILVNGEHVTVRYQLSTGDTLEIEDRDTEREKSENIIPNQLPLCILYEDDNIIVLNKPPHMPTHPSHGHITDTLANALAYRYMIDGVPFVFRPLGRLDRNTSGVIIAGKTRAASGFLGRALMRGDVKKCYVALLQGQLECDGLTHTIDVPIMRSNESIIMRTTCDISEQGAEDALTHYRVLLSNKDYSVVLAEPVTGRTHQLRVHFSHIGHAIVGDDIYGNQADTNRPQLIDRHALHALSICIPMPFFRAINGIKNAPVDNIGIGGMEDMGDIYQFISSQLNTPTDSGILRTFAPLPQDMSELISDLFPEHSDLPKLSLLFE